MGGRQGGGKDVLGWELTYHSLGTAPAQRADKEPPPRPHPVFKPENFQHCSLSIIEEQESWSLEGGLGKGKWGGPQSSVSPCHIKAGKINGAKDLGRRVRQVHDFSEFHPPPLIPGLSGKEGEHFRRSLWNVSFQASC